jgi:hypothetical protein
VLALVGLGFAAAPASAKGPLPVIGEPDAGLRSGTTVVVPISTEWPDGVATESLPADMWGDALPWTLLAHPADVAVSQGTPLPVRHVGPDAYEAEFTPPTEGEWRLSFATVDDTGTWHGLAGVDRTFTVASPAGASTWFVLLVVVGAIVLPLAIAVALWRRVRRRPALATVSLQPG